MLYIPGVIGDALGNNGGKVENSIGGEVSQFCVTM